MPRKIVNRSQNKEGDVRTVNGLKQVYSNGQWTYPEGTSAVYQGIKSVFKGGRWVPQEGATRKVGSQTQVYRNGSWVNQTTSVERKAENVPSQSAGDQKFFGRKNKRQIGLLVDRMIQAFPQGLPEKNRSWDPKKRNGGSWNRGGKQERFEQNGLYFTFIEKDQDFVGVYPLGYTRYLYRYENGVRVRSPFVAYDEKEATAEWAAVLAEYDKRILSRKKAQAEQTSKRVPSQSTGHPGLPSPKIKEVKAEPAKR